MRSIIWTTNEEFAQKLLTQIIGGQPIVCKRKTNAEYWIEYGDEYNIVYWIRGNDCFCGLRCDVSYVDTDTCSVQYFDTVIRVMTSLGKYGNDTTGALSGWSFSENFLLDLMKYQMM